MRDLEKDRLKCDKNGPERSFRNKFFAKDHKGRSKKEVNLKNGS
jgi:hypothetical protein